MKLEPDPQRKVSLITNLSYGPQVFSKLQAIIARHPGIGISCSLDSIGENFTRKYHNWDLWDANFRALAKGFMARVRDHDALYLHVNITTTAFNYQDVREVLEYILVFRDKGVNVTFDLNQLALNQLGSVASTPLDKKGSITLKPKELALLTNYEKRMILAHNRMLREVKYDPKLDEFTQVKVHHYR